MKATKVSGAVLVGIASLLVGVFSFSGTVAAQSSDNTTPMKISPLRSDITVEAGQSTKVSVYVTNMNSKTTTYKLIENDFVAGDDKGTPALILDANSYAPSHSLKKFMVPLQDISIPAGETKQVDVTINVPKNAQAGGYFGAVRVIPTNGSANSTVSVKGSVTSLILLTVPGDLVENVILSEFKVQQKGTVASNFRNPDNLEMVFKFENTGNVQIAPVGEINVSKGHKVVYSSTFNREKPGQNILPDSSRKWTVPIKKLGKFGKYTIQANFTYGKDNQNLEVKKTIWIVPTMYIIGMVVGLTALSLLVFAIVTFLRSYKKKILKQSRRR